MSLPVPPTLQPIDPNDLSFEQPAKRIITHDDLPIFHSSPAYSLITSFIVHLNAAVSPLDANTNKLNPPEDCITSSQSITVSFEADKVTGLVNRLAELVDSVPPDPGPRRFGNVAFRKWLQLVDEQLDQPGEMDQYLPAVVLPGKEELLYYLKSSFGSGERLDYGTGHELSFAAFLCGIWVLGGFKSNRDEKALVFRTFDAYFKLVRKLVTAYNLEPAGSHGVWGLDDHVFLPYIFGSAQLTTFRPTNDTQAAEDNAKAEEANLPKPADVVKLDVVNRERSRNLYFDAIGFIYDVKKGPFWEHSPILYDISGVQKGWGKINEGMLKMYDKEVLGKFPVVQHFCFGSIFRWSTSSAPASESTASRKPETSAFPPPGPEVTRAPWATGGASSSITTSKPGSEPATTRAPWAAPQPPPFPTSAGMAAEHAPPPAQLDGADTKAPWATARVPPPPRPSDITPSPSTQAAAAATEEEAQSPPWEKSKEKDQRDEEASGANVKTQAHLGPRRTSSPDSALARAAKTTPIGEGRRPSVGSVRVAETGDLSGRRPSRTG